jgi:hypothetical protein
MTYEQLYSKLQKEYTKAAQQIYALPTDSEAKRKWQIALTNLLGFFSRFRGKKIKVTDEIAP